VETRARRFQHTRRACRTWAFPFSSLSGTVRLNDRARHTRALSQVVDTVLAKLFARAEKTTDLYALLDESDIVILPEVEPVFRATGQYSALCKTYSKRGLDAALLEAWSKCVGSFSALRVRMVLGPLTTHTAGWSRASGQTPRSQIRCQTCLRCSRPGVIGR
jgi:hypothetical protein